MRGHDHRPDQQRLQHPADAHGHGPGPPRRRVPPDTLHHRLHRGVLALAAGRAHLAGGAGDPPQPAGRPRRATGQQGMRPGSAEKGRPPEGAVHRGVHAAHSLQLREDTDGGTAPRGAQPAEPGRLQDNRPARHPAGRLPPAQLCELHVDHDVQARHHREGDQGAVSRRYLCVLQHGAVRGARCLWLAQRGTFGAAESSVPLLLPVHEGSTWLDCESQLAPYATQRKVQYVPLVQKVSRGIVRYGGGGIFLFLGGLKKAQINVFINLCLCFNHVHYYYHYYYY